MVSPAPGTVWCGFIESPRTPVNWLRVTNGINSTFDTQRLVVKDGVEVGTKERKTNKYGWHATTPMAVIKTRIPLRTSGPRYK